LINYRNKNCPFTRTATINPKEWNNINVKTIGVHVDIDNTNKIREKISRYIMHKTIRAEFIVFFFFFFFWLVWSQIPILS
jgi:hypothetical protein